MKRAGPIVVALLGATALAACGGGGGPPGATSLEIAGAAPDGSGFAPFAGGDCALIPGSQGGFHVWLKLRTRGVAAGFATLKYTARRKSDGRLLATSERRIEVGGADSAGAFVLRDPVPVFMCPSPLGTRVMDERMAIEVTLSTESGAPLGSASDEAVPRCPGDTQAEFCARICAG